jgi:hypothetical protein
MLLITHSFALLHGLISARVVAAILIVGIANASKSLITNALAPRQLLLGYFFAIAALMAKDV